METLKAYAFCMDTFEGTGINIDSYKCSTAYELLLVLVMFIVKCELSYDPTMSSKQDAELIRDIVTEEVNKWRQKINRLVNI